MLDIAGIDRHLSQQGAFCLVDWLLSENYLPYAHYEAWRYGKLDNLDGQLLIDNKTLVALLSDTAKYCTKLKLCSEPHQFFRWDGQQKTGLKVSNNPEWHQQLSQRWLRPQELPQMDLFMDNSAAMVENALREALSERHFDVALERLQILTKLNPEYPRLGEYQDLINYGQHMQTSGAMNMDTIEPELQALQREVYPLAREILGPQSRDYLSFAWRRLADMMTGVPFDQQAADCHRSFALMQIPDWLAIRDELVNYPALLQEPQLMERLAIAYERSQQVSAALLMWCLMAECHPVYTEETVDRQRELSIYALWEDFWAYYDEWPIACFPAFVLASQPGLIHQHQELLPLSSPASEAMIQLLRCVSSGQGEIAARKALQSVNPVLLTMYLSLRGQ